MFYETAFLIASRNYSQDGYLFLNDMKSHFLTSLKSNKTVSEHSTLLASMSIKQGGLGIQHPRSTAIPAYLFTMKRNIQFMYYRRHLDE